MSEQRGSSFGDGDFALVSPVDGRVFARRPSAAPETVALALSRARIAQQQWSRESLQARQAACGRLIEALCAKADALGEEITWQMGRPIRYSAKELSGARERADCMIAAAGDALSERRYQRPHGAEAVLARVPAGVILVIAPWNYPYLTAVNTLVPALVAGNAVIVKHSPQTLLCAERIVEAATEAGLPEGLVQALHTTNELTQALIKAPEVDHVAFTGSVATGRTVGQLATAHLKSVTLELGGKDPAYVRADADLDRAVEGLLDGVYFNSGQSCCAVERIYVARALYDRFVEAFVAGAGKLKPGNPLNPEVTLGPVVNAQAAIRILAQTQDAVRRGARPLIDSKPHEQDLPSEAYLWPQVLVDVDHSMPIMRQETFGPVACIMPVADDAEAIRLMNDSDFGLAASLWTTDGSAAREICAQIDSGSCLVNRCDYLDPVLAWSGRKQSGIGCSLSIYGYDALTRPRSLWLDASVAASGQ